MNDDMMTTLAEAVFYSMEGKSPSKAIENQEKRGQQLVVRNQKLPKKLNELSVPKEIHLNGTDDSTVFEEWHRIRTQNNIEYTKQQYEKMGIIIVDEYDDLFWNVKLPDGWEIKATGHSMWNDLFDNKGRKRANFFYKAAFYDRDAFINFETRYRICVDRTAGSLFDLEALKQSDYQGTIKDGDEIIFSTECIPPTGDYIQDIEIQDSLREQLKTYMNEHYPNYQDIHSYWD